jgi:arylsulfatase A-like enzyme
MATSFARLRDVRGGRFSPSRVERDWVRDLYRAEVRYTDRSVGALIESLERLGLYEDSLIVFTSDHGEEFWEHDGYEHGHSLYREVLAVPLIVKLPRSSSRAEVARPVSTEGVMATILDVSGVPYERESLSSGSLAPLWGPAPPDDGPILSTGTLYYEDRVAIHVGGFKYIQSLVTGREELYDLERDPAERVSLAGAAAEKVHRARELLAEVERGARKTKELHGSPAADEVPLDASMEERLRSLGYLQ